jgi:hypothetical protein
VYVRAPRLVEIGESEVDLDVGIGGFVPDHLDSGVVERISIGIPRTMS